MTSAFPPGWKRWCHARLAVLALAAAACGCAGSEPPLRMATGSPGGVFHPVGAALSEVLGTAPDPLRVVTVETAGGVANAEMLERGDVELALISHDVPGHPRIRTVVPLMEEVLHVLVRRDLGITSVTQLRGLRVNVGPVGSSTHAVSRQIMEHLALVADASHLHALPHPDAVMQLRKGTLDAAVLVVGLGASVVENALADPGITLLGLGVPGQEGSLVHGVLARMPSMHAAMIPERAYHVQPVAPVATLGVQAVLGAGRDVPDDVVQELARKLLENRAHLVDRMPVLTLLSERFDPAALRFPLHPGALDYLHRNDPPMLVVWADALSLALSLVILAWSGGMALRSAARRRRKDRVDRYYLEVQQAGIDLDASSTLEQVREIRKRLNGIRRRAFEELVAERLEANESFTIFQDYLRSELAEVDAVMNAIKARGGGPRKGPP